jgi:tetratricopeptide (TPR) repeat protein
MKDLIANFESELDILLKQYLAEEDLNQINLKISPQKEDKNNVSEKINDFYRNQLDINIDSFEERIKIDRTITFSEKQLIPDEFCEFMLDLGKLCISSGKLNFANEIFKKTIKSTDNTLYKAESLLELADVFSRRADWSGCLRKVGESEKMYKEIKDSPGLVKCYNLRAVVYGEQGDIDKAKTYFQKSLSLINKDSDLELAANLSTNLGIIENIQENKDDAIMHLKNALIFYRKLGNQKRMAEVNYNIGLTYSGSGEYESAIDAFDEGIEIAKNGRFISILCLIYLAKSQTLIEKDDINSAAVFVDKAFEFSHEVDDKLTSADIYKVKGTIERRLKNFKLAESFLLNSLRINTSLNNEMNIAETSLELAALYNETDNPESKEAYLKSALNYYKQIDASQKVKKIEAQLGRTAA